MLVEVCTNSTECTIPRVLSISNNMSVKSLNENKHIEPCQIISVRKKGQLAFFVWFEKIWWHAPTCVLFFDVHIQALFFPAF